MALALTWVVAPTIVANGWSNLPLKTHYIVQENAVAPRFPTLTAALAQWVEDQRPDALVTILDSRTYQLPASITLRNEGFLVIEAANRERPLLQTVLTGWEIDVSAPVIPSNPDRNASLTLSGVVVEGFLHITGDIDQLRLLHSALIPGRRLGEDGQPIGVAPSPSLTVAPLSGATRINTQLRVQAAFSITGLLVVPEQADGIWLLDCIADGIGGAVIAGPADAGSAVTPSTRLTVERSTIFGPIRVRELEASDTIFTG
jgi:hypothetical protein